MVGFVIVSHSGKLAEGVADLAGMMAKDVEGAVTATVNASAGMGMEEILKELEHVAEQKKL